MSAEVTGKAPDAGSVPQKEDALEVGGLNTKVKLKDESEPSSGSELGEAESGAIDEKALLRKIDWRLLPAVGVLYLLSFLDRSNVGNARIEGLTDDLGMTGNQYLTGLTLYFIGYVLFEVSAYRFLLAI
jgi:hypothetical protein